MKKEQLLKDKPKNKRLEIRLSEKQLNYVLTRAQVYANGDLSAWVRHCLLDYKPKKIKGEA